MKSITETAPPLRTGYGMPKTDLAVKIIYFAFIAALLNLIVSCTYYRFTHSNLTDTQLFIHIPQSFIWNLK